MAKVVLSKKSCAVNPLKMSQPIGGALAFLGIENTMPVLHGSQGCTAFGMVLFVRHFRESIPLQTTAMSEAATILGGFENIEQGILNIKKRANPKLIGICSTGLTETKGDDVSGYLNLVRQRHPEIADTALVYVSTPDFTGAFQDGFGAAAKAIAEELVSKSPQEKFPGQVNILAGSHLTPADVEEVKEMAESFGLVPIVLPDLSSSLDGHVPEDFSPTSLGGTKLADIARMGASVHTIVLGEQMLGAAEVLARLGVSYTLFTHLTGLAATDGLVALLSHLSGNAVPEKWKRERSRLVDAMLDGHFFFGKKKVALAAEPDLLFALASFFTDMGAEIHAAVTTTESSLLAQMPAEEVLIGDLEDFEARAKGADLLVTHAHGRQASERLGIPLFRAGLPIFDRLGAAHKLFVGYRGTRNLIFETGNIFIEHLPHPHPMHHKEGHDSCEEIETC